VLVVTLILNEIHLLRGLSETMLIAGADRRVTVPGGDPEVRRKLFRIPQLNATVSYFGVADVFPGGKIERLSSWLPNFIVAQSAAPDMESFAKNLRDELQRVIPRSVLEDYVSGFHMCGYNDDGLPDFWHFTNVGRLEGLYYKDLRGEYGPPSPDFLGRDAQKQFGWDGADPKSARNGVRSYRNGDLRAHVAVWRDLDESLLKKLFQFPGFRQPASPAEAGRYVKFKFEVLAYIYKYWAKQVIISRPVDVYVLHNLGGEVETVKV
jgi:hypothetical protein